VAKAARSKLVEQNMGLVGTFSARLCRKWPSLDFDDVKQQAAIALFDATTQFDPRRGFRFSTYATLAIIRRITQYRRRMMKRRHPGELIDFDTVRDHRCAAPEDRIDRDDNRRDAKRLLRRLMRKLTDQEVEILKLRFGFIDQRTYTFKEISGQFGVSKERIRQIQEKALDKCRRAVA